MRSQVTDAGNEQVQIEDLPNSTATHSGDVLKSELAIMQANLSRTDRYLDRLGSDLAAMRFEAERLKLVVIDLRQAEQEAFERIADLTATVEARDDTIAAMVRILEQRADEIADVRREMETRRSASGSSSVNSAVSPDRMRIDAAQNTALQRRLRNAEEDAALHRALVALMQAMLQVLTSPGKWWTSLLPGFWVRRLKYDRLRKKGLFDAGLYTKRYPDVIRAKADPLHHYVSHGLEEGRTRM